jgi:transketolase
MVATEALAAAAALANEGMDLRIVSVTRLKPLPSEILGLFKGQTSVDCVCVEEHSTIGGLADALSHLFDDHKTPHTIRRIGVPDRFGESGPPQALLEKFSLAGMPLIKKLKEVTKR